jgi:putative transcriptional regulator
MTSRKTFTGRLLVATPALADPNFERAVILILDHDNDGALGVVVNRPTEVSVTDILPMWDPVVTGPDVVFQGGPVSLDSALGLVAVPPGDEPIGVRRLHNGFGLVDLDTPPEVVQGGVLQMRIFAGYAGWSPDQLEAEIASGAWYVVDAETTDPFTADPTALWRRVLRRQAGPLAMVATFPSDPSLN